MAYLPDFVDTLSLNTQMATLRHLNQILSLGIASIAVGGILTLQTSRLQGFKQSYNAKSPPSQLEQQQQRTQSRLIAISKMPSFGFENLIASWSFLQFLQYFGDTSARRQTGYGLSPYFFEAIIPKDPYHLRPYIFLSSSTSAHAAMPARAIALMDEGLIHMNPSLPSDSYLVWRYKGLDEFLFLGDYTAAQVSLETAADWVQQSETPDREIIANSLRQTSQFLAQNPTGKEAQIGAWAQVLVQAADEATQKIATEHIEALGGEIIISETGQVSVRYRSTD